MSIPLSDVECWKVMMEPVRGALVELLDVAEGASSDVFTVGARLAVTPGGSLELLLLLAEKAT